MSNKKLKLVKDSKTPTELPSAKDFKLIMHPNRIFAVPVDKNKTDGGIIIPESVEDRTPIAKVLAIGSNVKEQFDGFIEENDKVYVNLAYGEVVEFDGHIGVVFFADGILAKVPS